MQFRGVGLTRDSFQRTYAQRMHIPVLSQRRSARRCECCADQANVLIVGGGGREHALAWKLAQSPACSSLYCAPGNPGIAIEPNVTTVPDLDVDDHSKVVSFCKDRDVELVLVGPEAPLVDGLVDSLAASGVPAFGPTKAAAQLEGSKAFMKDLCRKYDIPTAQSAAFDSTEAARAYIAECGAPIVVKASGLAAGKGVILAETVEDAQQAATEMLEGGMFGSAGKEIVVEEFLQGEEASYFALIDGASVVPLGSAQDHKAVFDGDKGPNTGGMGAYSPAPVVTPELEAQVLKEIVQRTADAMVSEGIPFRGVLFAGLMIKDGKAKLLEHNVRFGDPECQCLMQRLDSDLLPVLQRAAQGGLSDVSQDFKLQWSSDATVGVVMATSGYPGSYEKGSKLRGVTEVDPDVAKVFHAGTADKDGELVAAGGRVLCVTARGATVSDAQKQAYQGVKAIDWPEGFYRTDIAWRAIQREAEGSEA